MNRLNKNELELYSSENDFLNAFKTVLKNDEEINNNLNKTRKQSGGTIKKRKYSINFKKYRYKK